MLYLYYYAVIILTLVSLSMLCLRLKNEVLKGIWLGFGPSLNKTKILVDKSGSEVDVFDVQSGGGGSFPNGQQQCSRVSEKGKRRKYVKERSNIMKNPCEGCKIKDDEVVCNACVFNELKEDK